MSLPSVWVTGAGVVSALGTSFEEFNRALFAGESAVRERRIKIPQSDGYETYWGACLGDDYKAGNLKSTFLPLMDRASHFALDAADQALRQSGLMDRVKNGQSRGIIICGMGMAGIGTVENVYSSVYLEGKRRVHPFTVPRLMPSAPNSLIAMQYGLQAPGFSVSSACASSNHAIGLAFSLMKSRLYDWAIVGGAESGLSYISVQAWRSLKVMSPSICAPFSEGPVGFAIGEGAGMFVLETEEHARGHVEPLCEISGFGMTSDGEHMTQMNPVSAAKAVAQALDSSGLQPGDVDYINAHGTGTDLNDRNETDVIRMAYGSRAEEIPVSSSKGAHGHVIAATSAIEMMSCVEAIRSQKLPPTANFTKARPGVTLNIVHGAAQPAKVDHVVSHAFGFGGLNAVLTLSHCR